MLPDKTYKKRKAPHVPEPDVWLAPQTKLFAWNPEFPARWGKDNNNNEAAAFIIVSSLLLPQRGYPNRTYPRPTPTRAEGNSPPDRHRPKDPPRAPADRPHLSWRTALAAIILPININIYINTEMTYFTAPSI